MNNKKFQIVGVFIIFILNVFLHFLYDLSNQNSLVSLIAPVNESVFEHLKMVYYSYMIFNTIEYILYPDNRENRFLLSSVAAVFTTLLVYVLFSIIMTGIGEHNLIITLLILFISIILGQLYKYYLVKNIELSTLEQILVAVLFIILPIALFTYFTVNPLNNPLFYDPTI